MKRYGTPNRIVDEKRLVKLNDEIEQYALVETITGTNALIVREKCELIIEKISLGGYSA